MHIHRHDTVKPIFVYADPEINGKGNNLEKIRMMPPNTISNLILKPKESGQWTFQPLSHKKYSSDRRKPLALHYSKI